VHSLRRSLAGATCGTVTVAAIILAAYPARVEGSNGYFPEGVKLPSLPKFEPRRESDAEFERNNFALQVAPGTPQPLAVSMSRALAVCLRSPFVVAASASLGHAVYGSLLLIRRPGGYDRAGWRS
jgi:hypothetical protein